MNKKLDKFILFFLILQPFIDVITSIQIRNNITFTVGSILRGIFFIFVIIYLYKKNLNKKLVTGFLIYFILAILYYFLYTKNSIYIEIINIIKIFYLPFLIHFFIKYKNKNINDKLILELYLIYTFFIIFPYIFGFGFNVYKVQELKSGYIGLFYSGNEISSILLGLFPIVLNYILKSKNILLKIIVIIQTIISFLLIGTKTLFIGFFIVIIYYIFKYIKDKNNNTKNKLLIMFIFIILSILTVIFVPKSNVYKNAVIALDYYKINKISDIKIDDIDNLVFSKRLTTLSKVNNKYIHSETKTHLYGLGYDKIRKIKDIEIDIFDIFYSIGIFGTLVYIIVFYQKNKLKKYYKFSFVLFLLMSIFSGHILLEPMVSIYISLLFVLSNNYKEDNRTKILLVSNMYPSKKYKYYGSFIKNVNDLLKDNDFYVDKVVKYKETSFIGKLFGYLLFYTKTILKGIFNNYDYIYVHYISHSSLGTIIPILTSKNTKLILNAHGNDVVIDNSKDEKNIKRSKKALKYAYKVIVPSKYYKSIMIEKYNVKDENIIIYPSGGVDTSKFKYEEKEIAKKKCKLDDNYKYIGYISRIEKNKGWDIFLKTIKLFKDENKIDDKKFLIVGTGNEENQMQELIKKLDIKDHLEIRNMVSQEELVNLYNSLDIFVFPTYRESESLGLVGLEAMACEKIVVASKNYGPTDYVVNEKNGLFFEPKNEKDLKEKIIKALNLNNEKYKKMVKKARETAIKYDLKNTKEIIINVFKEKK